MVAIASLPTTAAPRARAAAAPARPGPGVRRPPLSLVPPHGTRGRTIAGHPVGAVVAALVLALAVVLAAGYLVRTPTVAPGAAATGVHVVAEGETMWSIAVEHAPAGEAADYVERLVSSNGGAAVVPGQELVLPAR